MLYAKILVKSVRVSVRRYIRLNVYFFIFFLLSLHKWCTITLLHDLY